MFRKGEESKMPSKNCRFRTATSCRESSIQILRGVRFCCISHRSFPFYLKLSLVGACGFNCLQKTAGQVINLVWSDPFFNPLKKIHFPSKPCLKKVVLILCCLGYQLSGDPTCSIQWHNLKVTTKAGRQLLHGISGIALPGEVVALMGASGAGKTTLLNSLLQRNLRGLTVEGEILVNGHQIGKNVTSVSAYVQQEDLFVGTLTVDFFPDQDVKF